ncbi:histidinol-phosphate transaminase [Nocardioides caldifontis]|uniref:histidinol-phosphate transaminase n=1 Tax=Nocardioides caldifontis TaxID=2588938 RepID=UPI0011DFD8F4|nr:histidinol-phosphate transaminase [Nocardioides caldifontis]
MNAPRPRAALAAVPAYVAGRPPTPVEGLESYKLSSNENPFPPVPEVLEAVQAAAQTMNRYPDMGSTALYAALADHLGVRTEELAVATGSVALLYHLVQAFCDPGDEVVYAWRSFEAYPIATAVCGATAVQVPLTADGRHDLDAMAAQVGERTKVVLLCTPNNPTGPALRHGEVEAFLARVPSDVVVVLDEAYGEFVRGEDRLDALALLRQHGNVAVMRTFAKAYGLAGLRVGYLVGSDVVAGAVRACALPFGVSGVAQAAAAEALRHQAAMEGRVAALVAERDRVHAGLLEQGWSSPEPQGNFVWLPLGADTARFAGAAEAQGLVVRPYGEDGVRITIGEVPANDRFLRVAAEFEPKA